MARGFGARESAANKTSVAAPVYKSSFGKDDDFGRKLGKYDNTLHAQLYADYDSLRKLAEYSAFKLDEDAQKKVAELVSSLNLSVREIKDYDHKFYSMTGENSDTPPEETPEWEDAETMAQYEYEAYLDTRDELLGYLTSKSIKETPLLEIGAKGNQNLSDFLTKAGGEGYEEIRDAYRRLEDSREWRAQDNLDYGDFGRLDDFGVDLKPVEVVFAGHKYAIEFNHGDSFYYTLLDEETLENEPSEAPKDFNDFVKDWVTVNYLGPVKK